MKETEKVMSTNDARRGLGDYASAFCDPIMFEAIMKQASGIRHIRNLFFGIGLTIVLWSSAAIAQSCAPELNPKLVAASKSLDESIARIGVWTRANALHQEYERAITVRWQLSEADLLINHANDIIALSSIANKEVVTMANYVLGDVRVKLQMNSQALAATRSTISVPLVANELRGMTRVVNDAICGLANCRPLISWPDPVC
jgi:hypothetical protein